MLNIILFFIYFYYYLLFYDVYIIKHVSPLILFQVIKVFLKENLSILASLMLVFSNFVNRVACIIPRIRNPLIFSSYVLWYLVAIFNGLILNVYFSQFRHKTRLNELWLHEALILQTFSSPIWQSKFFLLPESHYCCFHILLLSVVFDLLEIKSDFVCVYAWVW